MRRKLLNSGDARYFGNLLKQMNVEFIIFDFEFWLYRQKSFTFSANLFILVVWKTNSKDVRQHKITLRVHEMVFH